MSDVLETNDLSELEGKYYTCIHPVEYAPFEVGKNYLLYGIGECCRRKGTIDWLWNVSQYLILDSSVFDLAFGVKLFGLSYKVCGTDKKSYYYKKEYDVDKDVIIPYQSFIRNFKDSKSFGSKEEAERLSKKVKRDKYINDLLNGT